MKRIAIIGGDKREKVLIKLLARKGYSLKVLSRNEFYEHKNIKYTTDIKELLLEQDIVIAPMSNTDQEGRIKNTFVDKEIILDESFFSMLPRETIFIIGIAKTKVKEILKRKQIKYIEMALTDDIAILNAIPTSEGAINSVMSESSMTIYGSNVMIFGLGRIGFSLAWRLKALGAEVYAATRSKAAIARGRDIGLKIDNYLKMKPFLSKIDIFFNTVPALIIDKEYIKNIREDAYIYDLASSPGGTDFKEADKKGIKAKLLPGLPGKSAPLFAGRVIAENIETLIESASVEGVN